MHIHFQDNAAALILLLFLAIVFLQSGIDKFANWKGNADWLKGHFGKTIFKNRVPLLLGIIAVLEVISGLLAVVGMSHLLLFNDPLFAWYGAIVSSVSLLFLLLGQRIAQDYEGAKTIVIYLVPTVFLLYLLQLYR